MKAIKNRLNKLNKLAVVDEVDTVFLTQIDTGHFEVRYRIGGKNPKDIIEVYPTKEEAEKDGRKGGGQSCHKDRICHGGN